MSRFNLRGNRSRVPQILKDVYYLSEWVPTILPEILVITELGGFEASPGYGSEPIKFVVPFSTIRDFATFLIIINTNTTSHAMAGLWVPNHNLLYIFDPNGDPPSTGPMYGASGFTTHLNRNYGVRSSLYATVAKYFNEHPMYAGHRIDFYKGPPISCPRVAVQASGTCAYRTIAFMLAVFMGEENVYEYTEKLVTTKGKELVQFIDNTLPVPGLTNEQKLEYVRNLAKLV